MSFSPSSLISTSEGCEDEVGFSLYNATASKSSSAGEFVLATEQCYNED